MAARRRTRRVVLITAGPTREHLDDVRFLSNGSTGRMGVALAEAALAAGCEVRLVLGPTEIEPPTRARTERVTSTKEMLTAARRFARGAHVAIFAAAPADWAPARRLPGKPPKAARGSTLRLVPTPDVAATLGRTKGARVHVGFALESGANVVAGLGRALGKLVHKRFDAIVLNTPANLGRGGGLALWVAAPPAPRSSSAPPVADVEALPTATKRSLAVTIVARALMLCERAP